jgi:hypothetical protein
MRECKTKKRSRWQRFQLLCRSILQLTQQFPSSNSRSKADLAFTWTCSLPYRQAKDRELGVSVQNQSTFKAHRKQNLHKHFHRPLHRNYHCRLIRKFFKPKAASASPISLPTTLPTYNMIHENKILRCSFRLAPFLCRFVFKATLTKAVHCTLHLTRSRHKGTENTRLLPT